MKQIDWRSLAETLGAITWTDRGRQESGGTRIACDALIELIGDEALRDAVDFYVSAEPGHELARSVLWLLGPPAAMERCRKIFRDFDDLQEQADAINLLQVVADRRVLDWVPEFMASGNDGVRVWAIGIIDQLLIMKGEIELEEAMPLIEKALADPYQAVRSRAQQILEWAQEAARLEGGGATSSRDRD